MHRTVSAAAVSLCAGLACAQTATMPPHATVFTGSTRGYYFTAPADFRITGVKVLQAAGGTNAFMNWAVVRFTGAVPPPPFPAVTNSFTQLGFGLNENSANYTPVSFDVFTGDVIGVYGNTMAASGATTGSNSYTAATPQGSITILGNNAPLFRSGMQFHLGSATSPAGMHDIWYEAASFAVSRVEFTYEPLGVVGACCKPDGSCSVTSAANCASQNGVYQGDGSQCTGQCPQPPSGACCKPDGTCQVLTTVACAATPGGVYQGNNTQCTGQCPQPPTGACCFFAGCSILTSANCTAQAGAYQGNNTTCGSCPAVPPVFFSNCNIKTGTATLSGMGGLPAGSEWSECARDETDPLTANTTAGFGGSGVLRLADDFVVPAGGRNVAYVRAYAYLTGAVAPNATSANIRIWNGPPNAGGVVIFGDTTTNRLANNSFAPIYRCFNSVAPITGCTPGGAAVPDQTRHVQYLYLTVNQFLPAGTYWVDFNYTGPSFSPPTVQADAIGRQCDPNNSNALQFNAAWVAMADAGQGCLPTPVNQDLFFDVLGTAATAVCYPNCDHSTVNPCLNVQDFSCFLNSFANNETYANCDHSTIAPVLNVQDFSCFLNAFANGCSSC